MKIRSALLHLVLISTLLSFPSAAAAELLDLIPAATPAFVIVKNPAKAEKDLRSLFLPAGAEETGGLLQRLLGAGSKLEGLDENGPLVMAVPQFPFPLFGLSVKDYDLFLASLRDASPGGGAPAAQSPVPGVDMAVVSGKPVFVRKEGRFALLSPMPVLLTPSAPGAGVASVLGPEERSALEAGDIFLRIDVRTAVALLEPLLASYLTTVDQTSPQGGAPSAEPGSADVGQVIRAETELLMSGLRQVRSFSLSSVVTEGGLSVSSLTLPVPGSGFEKVLQKTAPGPHEMLGYFDEGVAWAGAYSLDPEVFKGLMPAMVDFLQHSGIYDLSEADVVEWKGLLATAFDVVGANSAYAFGPGGSGGAFSTLVVAAMKDAGKARTMMKDSLLFAERVLASSQTEPEMQLVLEQGVETYGGVPIDSFRFSLTPPGGEEEKKEFDAVMESMFGGTSLVIWVAFVDDLMVASYYTPTSKEVKGLIDRVRQGTRGTLTGSASFLSATAAFPRESLSVNYLSFPRFASLITGMVARAQAGQKLPPWPLKDEDLSGIGVSYTNPEGALRVDTFVPRAEAKNILTLIDYLRSLEKTKDSTPL